MASGFGAGAFGAGFAKSLTDVLLSHRKEQSAKSERDFQTLLPVHLQLAQETGDYSGVENLISTFNPELAKTLKKNSPFADLHKVMGPQLKMSADQTSQPAAATGAYGLPLPQDEPAPPGSPQPLEARTINTEPIPGTSAPPAGNTFFGSPVLTPTQRAEQAAQANVASDKLQIESRRKIAQQMGMTPEKAVDYALYGTRPPQEQRQSAEPYQAVDGVDADGKTVSAVFDQSKGLYVDAITKVPIRGFHKSPSASKTQTEFDQFLASYAKDKNKDVDALNSTERLDARAKYEAAGRAPTAGAAIDPVAMAHLALRQPAVLDGLNPTNRSAVLNAIAADPALSAQYEQSRMAPIRAQAQTALTTLNDLLVVDPKTGKATLTPGADNLYGMASPLTRRFAISGGETATAKAALDQLTGLQVIQLITDLKAQSKTGASIFGRLNQQEFNVLQQSATMLKGNISPERAQRELMTIREKLQKILQPSDLEAPPSGGAGAGGAPSTARAAAPAITLDTPVYIGADGKPTTIAPTAPAGAR